MIRRTTLLTTILASWLLLDSPSNAYTISIDSVLPSDLWSRAQAGSVAVEEHLIPTTLPFTYTSNLVDPAGASSTTSFNLSNSAFDFTVSHTRSGAYGSNALTSVSVSFVVDEDITYSASGWYDVTDADGNDDVELASYLIDGSVGGGTYVYMSWQWTKWAPDESFTLGLSESDYYNQSYGSLSGMLIAGHRYTFVYEARTESTTLPSPGSSASATGGMSLVFTPEPDSGLLLLVGLGAMARPPRHVTGRRRASKQSARNTSHSRR